MLQGLLMEQFPVAIFSESWFCSKVSWKRTVLNNFQSCKIKLTVQITSSILFPVDKENIILLNWAVQNLFSKKEFCSSIFSMLLQDFLGHISSQKQWKHLFLTSSTITRMSSSTSTRYMRQKLNQSFGQGKRGKKQTTHLWSSNRSYEKRREKAKRHKSRKKIL